MYTEGDNFIEFLGDHKIAYSSLDHLRKSMDSGERYDIVMGSRRYSVPLSTAILIHVDNWLTNMYRRSRVYREFMASDEFGSMAKPIVEDILGMVGDNERITIGTENVPTYPPLYDKLFEKGVGLQYNLVKKNIDFSGSESVMEVGSATGNLSMMLAKDAGDVTGLDLSPTFTEYAKKKVEGSSLKNCRFVNGSYPHDPGIAFDQVVSFSTAPDNLVQDTHRPPKAFFARFGDLENMDLYDKQFVGRSSNLSRFYKVQRKIEKIPIWGKNAFVEYLILDQI